MSKAWLNNKFLRNAIMLSSSTGLAQLIAILASPVLTRMYLPEDFGVFSIYIALLSFMTVIVCLRYELAITLPEENQSAFALLLVNIISIVFVCVLIVVVLLSINEYIIKQFDFNQQEYLLVFLPLSLLLAGLYKAGTYWVIRLKMYKYLAFSKLAQSLPQTITQITLGVFAFGTLGLVLGELTGKLLGNITLWYNIKKQGLGKLPRVEDIINIASKYRHFPLISSWSAMVNQGATLAPTLLLAGLYGTQVAGLYALVQRVLAAPLDLIGKTVMTLYIGEASELLRKDIKALRKLYLKSIVTLFLLGVVPTLVLFIYADVLFAFIFGEQWKEAGVYCQILSIAFLFLFSISPVSQTLTIMERQDIQLIWNICRLFSVVLVLLVASGVSQQASYALMAYTAVIVVFQIALALITLFQIDRLPA